MKEASEPKRHHSSHAGRHISPSANPLPKGQACTTCKARKVKCNAGTPACDACKRTAKFEGRDPELVVCQYGGKRCSTGRRKRPSKPKSRVSYASDDEWAPSSDDSSYKASTSFGSRRKARTDSDASGSSTPSLVAESSGSWPSSQDTVVDPAQPSKLAISTSVSNAVPMYAMHISESPVTGIPTWAPLVPQLRWPFETVDMGQVSPVSSSPVTPVDATFAMPDFAAAHMPAGAPAPFAAAAAGVAGVASTTKEQPLLTPLLYPGAGELDAAFDFPAPEFFMTNPFSPAPKALQGGQQRPQTPLLSNEIMTPGVFNDALLGWVSPDDYFAGFS